MKYIVLLRGINVSGQKKIKMAEFRAQLESCGFKNVTTYIQSGNIILDSDLTTHAEVTNAVQEMIIKEYGWEVPTLSLDYDYLVLCRDRYPFDAKAEELKLRFFTFLKEDPTSENIKMLDSHSFDNEEYYLKDRCVYFYAGNGYAKAKMNNNFFEKKLKVQATTRNWNTVSKLIELSKKAND